MTTFARAAAEQAVANTEWRDREQPAVEEFLLDEHGVVLDPATPVPGIHDDIVAVQAPILDDLRRVGATLPTPRFAPMVHGFTAETPAESEVLIDHFCRPYPELTKHHLLSALRTRASRPFQDFFVALIDVSTTYLPEDPDHEMWPCETFATASAACILTFGLTRDELVRLVDDRRLGPARSVLMRRIGPTRYRDKYVEWLDDPDLAVEAANALGGRRTT